MSATILPLLRQGGSLRYRPPHGFYVVLAGKQQPVSQAEARKAVESRTVRPNGIDQHGVYLFALSQKAANAVPAVRNHPQTLPARPAAVPHALRNLPALRREAGAEDPAPVHLAEGAQGGRVPPGAGRLDAPRSPGGTDPQAGKAGCVGCGRCGAAGASKQEMKGKT